MTVSGIALVLSQLYVQNTISEYGVELPRMGSGAHTVSGKGSHVQPEHRTAFAIQKRGETPCTPSG